MSQQPDGSVVRLTSTSHRLATIEAALSGLAERVRAPHRLVQECTQPVVDQLAAKCQLTNTGARRVERLLEDNPVPSLVRDVLRIHAVDDTPGLAGIELDHNGELGCLFAELETEAASF
jgi:type VI secretion system protein VasG